MQFELNKEYYGFLLKEEKFIKELNSTARLFNHVKSGARLLYIENDDDNKVFSISFRTPPYDNTGLPHILEHSVLCGSRKFPLKEPFVELAKGSLNTFLNAMTYPDKTVYPIASRNDKDFMNLMDVYLDAVLYPNIYDQPETLMQEGWHYELENKDDDLTYKGVVYNEMKGAFSSPEQVLFRKIQNSLYPNTPYGYESGGDPLEIPQLTQEKFLEFHKKYYHPSNSYIYLYGNGDIMEHLKYIDSEYLSNFDEITVESDIDLQPPFEKPKDIKVNYPVSAQEDTKDKTYLSLNYSIGLSTDPFLYLALEIMEYMLLDNPAAPLKKALLEAGIGKDVFGIYNNSILQPTFSIIAKDTNEDKKEAFLEVVNKTLRDLAANGIDKKLIEAAINRHEFRLREADFGSRPKGLIYGIRAMDTWLYGEDPTIHLCYDEPLSRIKEGLNSPLFENLIEKYFLNNSHSSIVVVTPEPGMAEKREMEIANKLKAIKSRMGDEELRKIMEDTRRLRQRQSEPDTPEALETIPMVSLDDIERKAEKLPLVEKDEFGVRVLHHPMFTNKIIYLSLLFDTDKVPEELIPYCSLLASTLGEISTKDHHYEDLSKEINIHTGDIQYYTQAFSSAAQVDEFSSKLIIRAKALVSKLPKLISLLNEIITKTVFDDDKRLREVLQQARSRLEMVIYQNGHSMAMSNLGSYFSAAGKINEIMGGITYYRFLADLERNYDIRKDEIIENLKKVSDLVFNKQNLLISTVISDNDYNEFKKHSEALITSLPNSDIEKQNYSFQLSPLNEGLMTPGDVQYVAKGFNFKKLGYSYTGQLQVLRTIVSLDYLWNRVRVQGGAYGAFAQFARSGSMMFASYRDPNLKETLDAYNQTVSYLESFDADQREMTKYIIGTINRLDTPLTPAMKGQKATSDYLCGIIQDDLQKERDEILGTTAEDIRKLSKLVKDVLDKDYFCVVGSETKIKGNKDIFKNLVNVFS